MSEGPQLATQGRVGDAVDEYHAALAIRSEDVLTCQLLTAALQESCPYDDSLGLDVGL